MKNKKHMIVSIDTGKTSEEIQHPFMIKIEQAGYRGNYINKIEAI